MKFTDSKIIYILNLLFQMKRNKHKAKQYRSVQFRSCAHREQIYEDCLEYGIFEGGSRSIRMLLSGFMKNGTFFQNYIIKLKRDFLFDQI